MKYETEKIKGDSLLVRFAMFLGTTVIAAYVIVPRWFDEGGIRKTAKFVFSVEGMKVIIPYAALAALILYVGCYHSP